MPEPVYQIQPLPFEQAINAFQGRLPLNPDQFSRLVGEAKAKAFTMAGVYREDMLAELYGSLDKALSEGLSYGQWKKLAQDIWASRGLTGPNAWHLETVFRTNLQTSYQQGRYRQLSDLAKLRPYWQYVAVMDGRTRPAHAALNGKVWEATHPVWDTIFPPNGFNCRCTVTSLSKYEMGEEGLSAQTGGTSFQPDPGWDYNPGKAHWGEGLLNRTLDQAVRQGGWSASDALLSVMDSATGSLGEATSVSLPAKAGDLMRLVGSDQAARAFYVAHALDTIGFDPSSPSPLSITDARGDTVLLSPRLVDHAVSASDLNRGRYVGLSRRTVEEADEIWLVPGKYPDGKTTMRRYYLRAFQGDDGADRALMVVAEFERRCWTGFNALPLNERTANQKRRGLLLLGGEQP